MRKNTYIILAILFIANSIAVSEDILGGGLGTFENNTADLFGLKTQNTKDKTLVSEYEDQSSYAYIEGATLNGQKGITVVFTGTNDLHYYADKENAPGGYDLKINAYSDEVQFGEAIFPSSDKFYDLGLEEDIEVYVGDFNVFVPIVNDIYEGTVSVELTGLACTSKLCLKPFIDLSLNAIDLSKTTFKEIQMSASEHATAEESSTAVKSQSYSRPFAFSLAILAGLILNIMPCVWPVLPIIVMRIWQQSQKSKAKSFGLGLSFCSGILLFFAAIAILNIVLRLGFDTVFQWGDQFRNPVFVEVLTLVMVVLALFMFGLFTFGIPSSVSSKAGSGSGVAGTVGMGFLAALLSTPCSFAILAAVFAWAQTQPIPIATITIMLMGVGMAVPYLVLTSIPGLVNKMPKPGGWMEKVKIGLGFLLLLIAAKVFKAVPDETKINVLYYAVILSICVWIFGWVNYTTTKSKKYFTRLIAIAISVVAGMMLLPTQKHLIDWQGYDEAVINIAVENDQPVLIKFTADWCMTCDVVDKFVFQKKDIANLIERKGILAIKADTTTDDLPATKALAQKYNEPGVPVTIILLPNGTEKHLVGMISKDDIIKVIESLPDITR